ncbi:response regulator [Pseudoalteromonas fenneropenaei]|uniref:Response regulator n=1 Tax=Pseudoalteromonas fenneropenaei TaxID=1737459 RepID=A0ABV7CFL7_9GAMM
MKTLKPCEIAKYCNVHHRSVSRWIANGTLKGFRLHGRGNYRVLMSDFIEFIHENKIPLTSPLLELLPLQEVSENSKNKPLILVVDDEIALCRAVKRVLSNDFNVHIANDGFLAGAHLLEYQPALVTLDLAMPGLHGNEIIQYIRSNPKLKQIKILVISGLKDEELELALALGADDILSKPFENHCLVAKVKALLMETSNV